MTFPALFAPETRYTRSESGLAPPMALLDFAMPHVTLGAASLDQPAIHVTYMGSFAIGRPGTGC